ncbi:DUF2683 family protein [Parapedobacter koreensis]|uniref:Uncharacterized protein n=1 Tax=Parapedobacter koreensis TaxID=332977 RepID=A0A1H7JPP2_9SPHI|nr:DUF2683 family protein [Parapedobacter koreensis]SEK76589.1 hypothetical protein SAMN05421740_102635 [Parapedobacter koreensis]
MESITIYPKNERQKSLLKSLLKELEIRFEIGQYEDETLLSEKDFLAKIDNSIAQAEQGKTRSLPKDQQREFLGL